MNFLKVLVRINLLVAVVCGARIFAITPMYGQSHWNVMDAVLQTLVSVGHNITVVTPYIKTEQIANYTQVLCTYIKIIYFKMKSRYTCL